MYSRSNFEIEICANSVESCLAAQDGGANRVELCAGIPEGGTTPSFGEISVAREILKSTRLHVIIRPRGGDFCYSELELQRMLIDIRAAKSLGADGIVIGCLTTDGEIDVKACEKLLQAADGMATTFHRAFDRCKNPREALEQLIALGFDRVLTSGQQATAELGIPLLKELQAQSKGRIGIMAGCGVNEQNIHRIATETGVQQFHFSARERQDSPMQFHNPDVYMGAKGVNELARQVTTAKRVKATIDALLHD